VFQPIPPDDPVRRRPDITLARERLRWEPRVELRTGLERTIEDFDRRMRGAGVAGSRTGP
jgi:UDP-glucuronate decarboxylase